MRKNKTGHSKKRMSGFLVNDNVLILLCRRGCRGCRSCARGCRGCARGCRGCARSCRSCTRGRRSCGCRSGRLCLSGSRFLLFGLLAANDCK